MDFKMTPLKLAFAILSCVVYSQGQSFNPVSFTLPPPPQLRAALSPNYALYNAEKLHARRIVGPTSFAFFNGSVYTITADRKVVDVASCVPRVIANLSPRGCNSYATCGLLSSIRVGLNGQLLVLDAYRGLFQINPANGVIRLLYSSTSPVSGRAPRYLNDVVQASNGVIFMSDSCDNFDAVNDIYIIMEGRPSGRIIALNPSTGATTEILRGGLVYPNGLELSADGTELFIAETGRARILRMSLLASNYTQLSTFAPNLPGVPGNIRRSSRGTFWVALSLIRHAGIPNSMDMYSGNPEARRRTVQTVDQNTIRSYYPRYGMVVETDQTGKIIGSLHDPTGQIYSSVSEATENEGLLYIASPYTVFVGRIVLPQGDGRVVTIDSVLQVMNSRCQIPANRLQEARDLLRRYIEQQTGTNATAVPLVTPGPQGLTTQGPPFVFPGLTTQSPPFVFPGVTQGPPFNVPATTQGPPFVFPGGTQAPQNVFPGGTQAPQNVFPGGTQAPQNVFPGGTQAPQNVFPGGTQAPQNVFPGGTQAPQNVFPGGTQAPQNVFPGGTQAPQNVFPGGTQAPPNVFPGATTQSPQLLFPGGTTQGPQLFPGGTTSGPQFFPGGSTPIPLFQLPGGTTQVPSLPGGATQAPSNITAAPSVPFP